eukprot:513120-Rhodomonas_salina.1
MAKLRRSGVDDELLTVEASDANRNGSELLGKGARHGRAGLWVRSMTPTSRTAIHGAMQHDH